MEEGFLRSASTQGKTLMIYSILGRTPLQDTVAGTPVSAVVSTTTAILSEEQEGQGQEFIQPTRVEQTVASVEYINN